MRELFVAALAIVAVGSSFAQDSPSNHGISFPNYRYETSARLISDVDFKNLKVYWHPGDNTERGVKLLNGSFKRKYQSGSEDVTLDLLKVLEGEGNPEQRAVVIDLDWKDCGGSCSELGFVQVFELQSGHPTVVQEIEYDRHAPNSGAVIDGSGTLRVTGRSSEPSPNCCPKSLEVSRFEWNGQRFVYKNSTIIPLDINY